MRIDKISAEPDRAGCYYVWLDNGQKLRLYRQTLEDHGLFPGLELTREQLNALRSDAGAMSAKMRAVRIVAASSVSRRDLQERLVQKGEDPQQAREAVEWMEQLNLVDDAETARQIVSRCVARGYGINRARQMLYEKKIPKHYWDTALTDYPDQLEPIVTFLRGRLPAGADRNAVKRATDALLRRGHNYSDIRRGLQLLQQDADDFLED